MLRILSDTGRRKTLKKREYRIESAILGTEKFVLFCFRFTLRFFGCGAGAPWAERESRMENSFLTLPRSEGGDGTRTRAVVSEHARR